FAANLYVLHHGRLAWDWQVDPAVLGLAVLVAGLGAMAGEVHVVRWTVREMRAARTRWQLRRGPDRWPSPRPLNHHPGLWERALTRSWPGADRPARPAAPVTACSARTVRPGWLLQRPCGVVASAVRDGRNRLHDARTSPYAAPGPAAGPSCRGGTRPAA